MVVMFGLRVYNEVRAGMERERCGRRRFQDTGRGNSRARISRQKGKDQHGHENVPMDQGAEKLRHAK